MTRQKPNKAPEPTTVAHLERWAKANPLSLQRMKLRPISVCLSIVVSVGYLQGCSSAPREVRRPTVAVTISAAPGARPSSADIAEIHRTLGPEIEKQGYVMAKSSRTADYFLHVRFPLDPLAIGRLTFERAEPTVPFLRPHETEQERRQRENKQAIAEMVREPK